MRILTSISFPPKKQEILVACSPTFEMFILSIVSCAVGSRVSTIGDHCSMSKAGSAREVNLILAVSKFE